MYKNAAKIALLLAGLGVSAIAGAYTVTGTLMADYYSDTNHDPDFEGHCCSDVFYNMVNPTLYNGLPTLNTAYSSNPSNPVVHDIDANRNINWWGRGSDVSNNSHLSYDGSGYTTMLPVALNDIYAPHASGSNDSSAFQTAVYTGWFKTTGTTALTFSLRADDDAFVFLDGHLVQQVGGVHPLPSFADLATDTVGHGWHELEIFYADRHTVDASLDFSINASIPSVQLLSAVPEPETWALLGLGMIGMGWLSQRSKKRADSSDEPVLLVS